MKTQTNTEATEKDMNTDRLRQEWSEGSRDALVELVREAHRRNDWDEARRLTRPWVQSRNTCDSLIEFASRALYVQGVIPEMVYLVMALRNSSSPWQRGTWEEFVALANGLGWRDGHHKMIFSGSNWRIEKRGDFWKWYGPWIPPETEEPLTDIARDVPKWNLLTQAAVR